MLGTVSDTGQEQALAEALIRLADGDLVAIPTETVYGLAADARDPAAVARIFALKGRPANHPVIVHLASTAALPEWTRTVPPLAWRLAEAFWPGPLTLILPRAPGVPDVVTGGQDSVGLRVPAHPLTRALLARFQEGHGGLAAPSANRFGQLSPTTAAHVRQAFGADCPFILDGGACPIGIESTIVSLLDDTPRLLRPGGLSRAELEAVAGVVFDLPAAPATQTISEAETSIPDLRAPGLLASHYAPRTPLYSGSLEQLCTDNRLAEAHLHRPDVRYVLLHWSPTEVVVQAFANSAVFARSTRRNAALAMPTGFTCYPMPRQVRAYAQQLYATLHRCDVLGYHAILIELPPDTPDWFAVQDRLRRSSTRRV